MGNANVANDANHLTFTHVEYQINEDERMKYGRRVLSHWILLTAPIKYYFTRTQKNIRQLAKMHISKAMT